MQYVFRTRLMVCRPDNWKIATKIQGTKKNCLQNLPLCRDLVANRFCIRCKKIITNVLNCRFQVQRLLQMDTAHYIDKIRNTDTAHLFDIR